MTILNKLKKLDNKKIAVLGLGIENYALIEYLSRKKISCAITVYDQRDKNALGNKFKKLSAKQNISWKLGKNAFKRPDKFDVLFRSPGWPLFDPAIKKSVKAGAELTSPINLFFSLSPSPNIIGVTGTKGKGTTASLIYAIFKQAKKRAWLAGNIGVAPFAIIDKIKKNDWIILELSSFQLEDIKQSPCLAIITNLFKDHLAPSDPNNPNYHKNISSYWQAKKQILKYQTKNDFAVINKKLKNKIKPFQIKSKLIYFDKSNLASNLVGEHNKENVAAASAAAKIAGVKKNIIARAVKKFKGLEHRLEFVKKINNIAYYNDSFATTPDAAITAIVSFPSPIILLAGGADKGSDFKKLAKIIKQKVALTILFQGNGSKKLKKELVRIKYPQKNIKVINSMKEAMGIANRVAKPGQTVLLSPGCASFGIFKNYKERGNLFKQEVNKLK